MHMYMLSLTYAINQDKGSKDLWRELPKHTLYVQIL